MVNNHKVDVMFQIVGREIPVDHGYALFSAINRLIPELHESEAFGVHPIMGRYIGEGLLGLSRKARLGIRTDISSVPTILPLAGKALEIDSCIIRVGVPSIFPVNPSPSVWSKVVNIKGFMEPDPFKDAVMRQLESIGVTGAVEIGRRVPFRIKDKKLSALG